MNNPHASTYMNAGHIPEAFYIVADHGRAGRETIIDWEACSKRDVIAAIMDGQHDRPLAVHCIDRDGGRWSDVSEDVAREIVDALTEFPDPHSGLHWFLEEHLGCAAVARLAREMEAV